MIRDEEIKIECIENDENCEREKAQQSECASQNAPSPIEFQYHTCPNCFRLFLRRDNMIAHLSHMSCSPTDLQTGKYNPVSCPKCDVLLNDQGKS